MGATHFNSLVDQISAIPCRWEPVTLLPSTVVDEEETVIALDDDTNDPNKEDVDEAEKDYMKAEDGTAAHHPINDGVDLERSLVGEADFANTFDVSYGVLMPFPFTSVPAIQVWAMDHIVDSIFNFAATQMLEVEFSFPPNLPFNDSGLCLPPTTKQIERLLHGLIFDPGIPFSLTLFVMCISVRQLDAPILAMHFHSLLVIILPPLLQVSKAIDKELKTMLCIGMRGLPDLGMRIHVIRAWGWFVCRSGFHVLKNWHWVNAMLKNS